LPNSSGTLFFCIPYASIEPVKEKFKQKAGYETQVMDPAWQTSLMQRIQKVPLEVSCVLGTATIHAGDLLELDVEDVIMLDQKTSHSVVVKIEDIPKFKGIPGACNKNMAVRIIDTIQKE
jgi:flagellar motor switch protein FliM